MWAAGLLEYVDAIESHGYADGGFAPEENDYPGKLAAINESMRRHNHGKVLPLYITEAGVRGMLGSKIILWAYLFEQRGLSILTVWSAAGPKRVSLPVGESKSIEVLDMMGHSSRLEAQGGNVALVADGSPQYLVGFPAAKLP